MARKGAVRVDDVASAPQLLAIGEPPTRLTGDPDGLRLGTWLDTARGRVTSSWLRGVKLGAQSLLGGTLQESLQWNTQRTPSDDWASRIVWSSAPQAVARFRFPGGPPRVGSLYVRAPHYSDTYFRAVHYGQEWAVAEISAFGALAAALGAKRIMVTSVRADGSGDGRAPAGGDIAAGLGLPPSGGNRPAIWRRLARPRAPAHVPVHLLSFVRSTGTLQAFTDARLEGNLIKCALSLVVGGNGPVDFQDRSQLRLMGLDAGEQWSQVPRTEVTFEVRFWPLGAWSPAGGGGNGRPPSDHANEAKG
jgi:hypothetical protein